MRIHSIVRRSIIFSILTLSIILSACGKAGNSGGSASNAEGASQGTVALTVEKSAPDTVFVSYTDEILNSLGDNNEVRLRFYSDEDRSGGYELSASPSFWAVSTIGESVPNLAEGTDIQKAGATWKWEIVSSAFYQEVSNCTYYEVTFADWDDPDENRLLADGKLKVTETNAESAKEENKAEDPAVMALLYEDEDDRTYMTPDTDDFRIIVYEIPKISVVYNYGIKTDDAGYPMAYVLFPSENERMASCKYVEVTSFDKESGVNIIRSKLIFENEEDALHPYVATSDDFWYYFEDYSGEYGVIPDDFDEDTAIHMICDEFIPDPERNGENAETMRKGNIWYKAYYDDHRQYDLDDFAGLLLYPNTSEYAARNTDENGFSSFTDTYQYLVGAQVSDDAETSVIVYYSKPEAHGKTDGPSYTLQDVQAMLNNPSDKDYFKPASNDYL
ncbi:MAG: hypothetical protein K6F00_06365, partial [Lachnospiraceae bacterium]|nr:hypothetical protein [Lachnospiraceae bacterium]